MNYFKTGQPILAKTKVLFIGAGIIWFCLFAMTHASEPPLKEYTLEDCIRIGLERSGALKNAFRDTRIGDTTIGQVRARIHPHLSINASYMRRDELDAVEFGDQKMRMGALDNYSASFGARQLLYSGGAVNAGLRAARDYRNMMEHEYARVRAELIRNIRNGVADILLLEKVVKVHSQAVEQLRGLTEQTEQRFRNEHASEFDLLNARVQLANALPDLIRADNDLSVARADFRNLINLEDEDFKIKGDLEYEPFDKPLETLLDIAMEKRPEILAIGRMVDLRSADIRVEQGAYLPSLHATGAYSVQDPPGTIASGEGWEWRWNVGLEAMWKVMDGGLRRHTVMQKRLEYDKTVEELRMLKETVELQVRSAFLNIGHAKESVTASRENVTLAERSLEIAETRYETGLITRLEFTDVNLARTKARLNRLQALRDHQHALNEMAWAVGWYATEE